MSITTEQLYETEYKQICDKAVQLKKHLSIYKKQLKQFILNNDMSSTINLNKYNNLILLYKDYKKQYLETTNDCKEIRRCLDITFGRKLFY